MPVTREKLISTAKSTLNPKSSTTTVNKNNFISSEDDLFERSASQSASRQTRTINHIVPKEVSKKLSHDFEAVSGKSKSVAETGGEGYFNLDKENIKNSNTTKKTVSSIRPLVKRAVSKASHTSSHSPNLNLAIAQVAVNNTSSVTKVPLSARRDIIDLEVCGADDPIFDVPVTSPSPSRVVNFDLNDLRAEMSENKPVIINTPSKHSKLIPVVSLRSPSVAAPLVAEFRRTPLTMAEKKRRQLNLETLDKTTKTNISAFKAADIKKGTVYDIIKKEEDMASAKVKESSDNNKLAAIESVVCNSPKVAGADYEFVGVIDVFDVINSTPKKIKTEEIRLVENAKVNFDPFESVEIIKKDIENEENEENIKSAQKQSAKKKKIFIRTQATESAPPDIKVQVQAISSETIGIKSDIIIDTQKTPMNVTIDDLSLVIRVPAPPKLEDLESLDPELYVKLKSGSLKDDLNVPFISETDRTDIENFLESFNSPEFASNLLPVAIIGEGTFSTVYKVIDKNFYECDNSAWTEYSRQNPLDWLRLWRWVYSQEPADKFTLFQDGKRCVDRNGRRLSGVRAMMAASVKKSPSTSKLAVLLRRYLLEWAMRSLDSLLPGEEPSEAVLASISPRALQSAMLRFRPYFIALKRINATSSPQRILDEMSFLKHLGGKNNVVPLINGLRCEDQVLVTFPYFYSDDFREFMGMQNFSINGIACYMRSLFISLAHLHAHSIIHRDVKPSNFLYAPEGGGRAVLLDFGLAQKASSSSGGGTNGRGNPRHSHVLTSSTQQQQQQQQQQLQQQRINTNRNNEKERKKIQAVNLILNSVGASAGLEGGDACEKLIQLTGQLGPGYFNNDPRAAMKASRAGTRGFRAPEVLFKCSNQTTALDIWSAGVILLTLLTRRYPFFHSSDDYDAIVEIANIFGNEEMAGAAKLYGRKWNCNVPSVPVKHVTWPVLCEKLNPSIVPEIPEECYDLLKECLNLNFEKRITARNALKHAFILKYAK